MIRAEYTIIGMCLNDPDNFQKAKAIGLEEHHFQEICYRVIWQALDTDTVADLPGCYPLTLNHLKEIAPLTQNVEFYATPLIWRDFRRSFLADLVGGTKTIPTKEYAEKMMAGLVNKAEQLRPWEGYRG